MALLTRTECAALRGIAILLIVLHNYCHWLHGMVHENEYNFNPDNFAALLRAFAHPDGLLFIQIMSFFGHYGVPIFLFLSAYGLVMKYETSPAAVSDHLIEAITSKPTSLRAYLSSAWRFMRYHYLKLFRMMILGFVFFLIIDRLTPGAHHYRLVDILGQAFMFNNLLPQPHHVIWPGPYWFFGLMVQLYLVYRLLLYRRHWGWTLALIILCTAAQYIAGPGTDALNYLRYNCVGAILPFGIGLLYARMGLTFQGRTYNFLFFIVSLLLIFHYSGSFIGWLFVPMFVCSAGFTLVKLLPQSLLTACQWLGGISAPLFVIHPILRKIFIPISHHGDIYTGLVIYLLASIVCAYLFLLILNKLPKPKI